jgi:hypothetical protein
MGWGLLGQCGEELEGTIIDRRKAGLCSVEIYYEMKICWKRKLRNSISDFCFLKS